MDFHHLLTETANPFSAGIESKSIPEITQYINQEDAKVANAVKACLSDINRLISCAVDTLSNGGRLIYVGAGTSGRLGILDASECPPTFGVSPERIQGIMAGGDVAIRTAQEGSEDQIDTAIKDLEALLLSSHDMVIGLAASGRTPYVLSALQYAKQIGSRTGSISCTTPAELSTIADFPIEVIVGPEVVTGSSRMKAGTAQKMILNMISTTCMIQLGKVYNGYMIDVQPTNEKLVARAIGIIQETTHCDSQKAAQVFEAAQRDVKSAIIMIIGKLSYKESQELLQKHHYHVANIIHHLTLKEDNS